MVARRARKHLDRFFPTALLLIIAALPAFPADSPSLNYDRDVRPILSDNCFQCHGQDSKKRMAGLRLDSLAGATTIRNGIVPLVPGHPESSAIYQRITSTEPARRMPPAYSNHTLTAEQIAVIKRWIQEGGPYAKHWAFVPPVRPPAPQVAQSTWVRNPIDAFILQRLEREGLKPSPGAAPAVWLRRVTLDLTGLAPTSEEIDNFDEQVRERGEAAYPAAVDRLLASPAYGERMAMDWLDVARYADTHGFNNDSMRSMWRWRDWVIASFNRNQPYNQFITEQLAGDLLPTPTLDQLIATGFGRNHVINSEGGIIDEEYRAEYVTDRVRTLGMAWMGVTLECAHCHDHKFDPITQRDHYRFYAFFNNAIETGEDGRVANAAPILPAPTDEQQAKMRALETAIAKLSQNKLSQNKLPQKENGLSPTLKGGEALCDSDCTAGVMAKRAASISKKSPFTFTLRISPTPRDGDVALISALDYSQNSAAASYGGGIELRLADEELEFRFSQRYPAYSMRVRSKGANLKPGETHQLTLVYEGGVDKTPGWARAAWVRIYADGLELPTEALEDDLPMGDSEETKPTTFRIGFDNGPGSVRYAGALADVRFWTRALSANEISPDTKLQILRAELLALRRDVTTVMVMRDLAQPRETHILTRGSYDAPGERVDAGVPEDLLGSWPSGAPRNRLGLAQWLTKPDHPLTSRVVVNRFWQQIFGTGIVKTSDNFGMQGEWPSHPELLDWLAREFVDSGWNVKALMKLMVLSSTYRQDSSASKALIALDPENRLLAHGPRFRLPAEVIRDQALEIAGLLKPRVGGPSVFPYQVPELYKGIVVAANYPGTKYIESTGDDLYRRSMYTFWKRTIPHPTMNVFDAPDREVCIVKRSVTNTPLQSLTLLNDPIFVEAARKLAERSIKAAANPDARLAFAFRLATGRAPDRRELQLLRNSLDRMLSAYRSDEPGARSLIGIGKSTSDSSIAVSELAAYTAVANIILNLDEVITKG